MQCSAGASGHAQYAKAIKDYLTANGPCKLSDLGSKVPKPSGVAGKLSKFLADGDLFSVDTNSVVSLR